MFKQVVFLCLVAVSSAFDELPTTEVSRCTRSVSELPIYTYIEGCVTPPCQFPQLQDAVIHLTFRIPHTIREMKTIATAFLLILPYEYDLREDSITCNFLTNTYCPVMAGEVVQYTLHMYIQSLFPVGTQTTIEFSVVDDNRNPITCIRVPIRILAPLSRIEGNSFTNNTLTIDV